MSLLKCYVYVILVLGIMGLVNSQVILFEGKPGVGGFGPAGPQTTPRPLSAVGSFPATAGATTFPIGAVGSVGSMGAPSQGLFTTTTLRPAVPGGMMAVGSTLGMVPPVQGVPMGAPFPATAGQTQPPRL